jgi:hypothetical protein
MLRDLLGRVTEDEDVLGADLFHDLDVRAIQGADGQRAIERELHVARARGLGAGRGDLLARGSRRG